jgi:hypothetical protein
LQFIAATMPITTENWTDFHNRHHSNSFHNSSGNEWMVRSGRIPSHSNIFSEHEESPSSSSSSSSSWFSEVMDKLRSRKNNKMRSASKTGMIAAQDGSFSSLGSNGR